jgi:hypothetical protein
VVPGEPPLAADADGQLPMVMILEMQQLNLLDSGNFQTACRTNSLAAFMRIRCKIFLSGKMKYNL